MCAIRIESHVFDDREIAAQPNGQQPKTIDWTRASNTGPKQTLVSAAKQSRPLLLNKPIGKIFGFSTATQFLP